MLPERVTYVIRKVSSKLRTLIHYLLSTHNTMLLAVGALGTE
jgi:hypothetical protein